MWTANQQDRLHSPKWTTIHKAGEMREDAASQRNMNPEHFHRNGLAKGAARSRKCPSLKRHTQKRADHITHPLHHWIGPFELIKSLPPKTNLSPRVLFTVSEIFGAVTYVLRKPRFFLFLNRNIIPTGAPQTSMGEICLSGVSFPFFISLFFFFLSLFLFVSYLYGGNGKGEEWELR
ncbi:hypothetical protein CDAR_18341 [Caerostris darwini]|uniref:Uncharacterized protein n=1 Tax=Caerostris darwini TaxID=1538125 RepID=A0AAV4VBC0_9ARAC|nr:hypothetical protein CDAR_18341 [Caerostris darwini]